MFLFVWILFPSSCVLTGALLSFQCNHPFWTHSLLLLPLCGSFPAILSCRWYNQAAGLTLSDLPPLFSLNAGSEEELEELCEQAVWHVKAYLQSRVCSRWLGALPGSESCSWEKKEPPGTARRRMVIVGGRRCCFLLQALDLVCRTHLQHSKSLSSREPATVWAGSLEGCFWEQEARYG